jgi:hypothetical protein
LVDIVSVTALVVSIVTVVFVIVREGFGLTLEYRESEATSKRKRNVDEKLKEDLKTRQKQYLEMERAQSNGEILLGNLEELGRCAFLTRSLTSNMLESMTRHIKSGLRSLAVAIIMLAVVILTSLFGDFSSSPNQPSSGSGYLIMIFALLLLAGFSYGAYMELGKHLRLREHFVKLSENPNLQYSEQLFNELRAADLF